MNRSKFLNRSKLITLESVNNFLRPLAGIIISILVIQFTSPEFWGVFVPLLIGVELVFNLINWGNRHYLIVAFSKNPHQINQLMSHALSARFPLLLIVSVIAAFFYPFEEVIFLILWATGRYIYHCFDAYILFHRHYAIAIITELVGTLIILVGILYYQTEISLQLLISLYAVSFLTRALIFLVRFGVVFLNIRAVSVKSALAFLKVSSPFFFLAISGLLQMKTDLYAASFYLSSQEIASYQILLVFLGIAQTVSMLLLNPFTKNIMRLRKDSLKKLRILYLKGGIVISLIVIVSTYIAMRFLYNIYLNYQVLLLSYFYIVILYTYILDSIDLMKNHRANEISLSCLITAAFNLLLCILLIPYFGIPGALISGIVSRIFLAYTIIKKAKNPLMVSVDT